MVKRDPKGLPAYRQFRRGPDEAVLLGVRHTRLTLAMLAGYLAWPPSLSPVLARRGLEGGKEEEPGTRAPSRCGNDSLPPR